MKIAHMVQNSNLETENFSDYFRKKIQPNHSVSNIRINLINSQKNVKLYEADAFFYSVVIGI